MKRTFVDSARSIARWVKILFLFKHKLINFKAANICFVPFQVKQHPEDLSRIYANKGRKQMRNCFKIMPVTCVCSVWFWPSILPWFYNNPTPQDACGLKQFLKDRCSEVFQIEFESPRVFLKRDCKTAFINRATLNICEYMIKLLVKKKSL